MVEFKNLVAKELSLRLFKIDVLLLWKDITNGNQNNSLFVSDQRILIILW
jgi:hypothetical protein